MLVQSVALHGHVLGDNSVLALSLKVSTPQLIMVYARRRGHPVLVDYRAITSRFPRPPLVSVADSLFLSFFLNLRDSLLASSGIQF